MRANEARCFACDRKLGKNPNVAITCDVAQVVFVGSECYKQIGDQGWQPPKGGPKLYRGVFAPNGELLSIVGLPGARIPDYVRLCLVSS